MSEAGADAESEKADAIEREMRGVPDALQVALAAGVLPRLREVVIRTLASPHRDWIQQLRAGAFDHGPLMRLAVAVWRDGVEGDRG